MDYLSWELERQRAALRALLGGGEARDGKAAPEGDGRSPAGPGGGETAAAGGTGRYAGGETYTAGSGGEAPGAWEAASGAWRREARETAAGEGGGPPPEDPEMPARARRREVRKQAAALRETAREGTGPRTGRPGGSAERPGGAAESKRDFPSPAVSAAGTGEGAFGGVGGSGSGALLPGETAWAPADIGRDGPWGGGESALRAEESARALSRAVQRDARRYDGGFTMY